MVNWHSSAQARKAIYDAMRISDVLTLFSSSTRGSGSTNSSSQDVGDYREAIAFARVTDKSGTNPTLDIKFQGSPDGSNFADLGDSFTQITTTGTYLKKLSENFGKYVRAVATIGGTDTPTFTFSLSLVVKG